MNVALVSVVSGTAALTGDRLVHVERRYLQPGNDVAAQVVLFVALVGVAGAKAWGGGLVAVVEGIWLIVLVRGIDARPTLRCFVRRRGVAWLDVVCDLGVGLAAELVCGILGEHSAPG